jgi:transcriptional regulator GlxA family with amidase domain
MTCVATRPREIAEEPVNSVERLIVVVLFEGVDLLDVTGPPEVFALARREAAEAAGYDVVLAAETLAPVTPAPVVTRSTSGAVSAPSPTPPW